ncbi:MAG: GGDEF domain-containing protein [Candidatus Parvarchaeota archaeon]
MLELDSLTKVFNRNYLKVIEKNHKDYIVAMLDIDFFKRINDVYGHKIGDEALKSVADNIKRSLRKDDIVIRYGGEEFLIFIKGSDYNNDCKILERLRHHIQDNPIVLETGELLNITVSIGANIKTRDLTLQERITLADKYLYEAKNNGRNKIVCGDI